MRFTNLLAVMGAVAAAFIVVLTIGFQLQNKTTLSNGELGAILGIAIPVIAIALFILVLRLTGRSLPFFPKPRPRAVTWSNAGYQQIKDRRIAELDADPARRKYAELMRRGGYWSDEQIAYH